MSKVLVTKSYLEDIADSIRSKNGSQATYTPSQMAEAIINIPSGSSTGVLLFTSDQWDAMTTAQKQAYDLVAIQTANSGYERGKLVNGSDYVPGGRYLPYSDGTKVICEAYSDNYDVSSTEWGYGSNPIQLSASGSIQNSDGSVAIKTKSNGTLAYVDLGQTSTPFTVYIVAKLVLGNGTYTRELGVMFARSSGKGLLLYGNNNINVSSWASDTGTGKNPNYYFVGALQFAGSGSAFGSAISSSSDTPSFITKSPSAAGRYITIGRTDIDPSPSSAEPSDMDVLFLGTVSEGESQSVVSQNMVYLAQEFIS